MTKSQYLYLTEQIDSLKSQLNKERKISAALLTQVKNQLDRHPDMLALFERTSHLQRNIAETSKKLLHRSNAFESLYQHSADGMLFIENNSFVECNNAVVKMFHYDSKTQILNMNLSQLSPEYQPDGNKSSDKLQKMMQAACDNGHHRFQWVCKCADEEQFWADIILTTISLNTKQLLLMSLRDISRLKQLEEGILKQRDAANHANMAKSEFLSKMSHELRTPMNAILGFAQILELDEDEFNDIQRDNIHEILVAGDHLLKLISDVLDLSKIESGKMQISSDEVSLRDILHQCIKLVITQAEEHRIKLIDNISHKHYHVQADAIRLKQVILNLLSNAVKYNKEHGTITLDCEFIERQENTQYMRISVSDTGSGLTKEEISKIFLPFERMNNNNNIEGVGIGLSITKNLIKLMGGKIGVKSTPDKGSTFWIDVIASDKKNIRQKKLQQHLYLIH